MALSKGLRLLWKQEPGPSALLESRTRQDCLLLEAGTVAALSKCPGPGFTSCAVRGGEVGPWVVDWWRWVRGWCLRRGVGVLAAAGAQRT